VCVLGAWADRRPSAAGGRRSLHADLQDVRGDDLTSEIVRTGLATFHLMGHLSTHAPVLTTDLDDRLAPVDDGRSWRP
jgi:hypothetical protein